MNTVWFLWFSGCSVSIFECCLVYFRVVLQIRFVAEKTPDFHLTESLNDYCVVSVVFRLF